MPECFALGLGWYVVVSHDLPRVFWVHPNAVDRGSDEALSAH